MTTCQLHSFETAKSIFHLPFPELIFRAQTVLREHFNPAEIQASTLLNIKTGGCSENCSYCAQSIHHKTGLKSSQLIGLEEVKKAVEMAKKHGIGRLCMGAAWRKPNGAQMEVICEMVRLVKSAGIETCMTLGMLTESQVQQLKSAGLDYYNHNVDTSPEFYPNVVTTRCFEDRLETIARVQNAGIHVCSGGILGLGESNDDRIKMLVVLANLEIPPRSVPINKLIPIPGTPLENQSPVKWQDFVRTIALARILMPRAFVRLSAGRESMSPPMQTLCFLAGANSIFVGEKLLTAGNHSLGEDLQLLESLGMAFENHHQRGIHGEIL